jgi:hypothetical protein
VEANRSHLLRIDPEGALRRFEQPDAPITPAYQPDRYRLEPELVLEGAVEPVAQLGRLLAWHNSPAFTPDGRRMAVWAADGPALVLESGDGRLIEEMPWEGPRTQSRETFRLALPGRRAARPGRSRGAHLPEAGGGP